ncbi:MAG TPA: SDR family NAD(P)-dependent oxidoreductase, partial [Albitalea sp.]|nr:SDR family NAD(P)-dependent oxidoreductase [Albitalea sp.]
MNTSSARTIVITGAAGALGQAVAAHFLAEGATLALLDRDDGHLRSVFAGRADAAPHRLLAVDVTSEDSLQAAAARQHRRHEGLRQRDEGPGV